MHPTIFRPLLLSSVITSLLASGSAWGDIYGDGYTAGYNAGSASCVGKIDSSACPTTTCPTVTQPTCPTVTQPTCPTVTQPTCPTVTQPTCPTVTQPTCPTTTCPDTSNFISKTNPLDNATYNSATHKLASTSDTVITSDKLNAYCDSVKEIAKSDGEKSAAASFDLAKGVLKLPQLFINNTLFSDQNDPKKLPIEVELKYLDLFKVGTDSSYVFGVDKIGGGPFANSLKTPALRIVKSGSGDLSNVSVSSGTNADSLVSALGKVGIDEPCTNSTALSCISRAIPLEGVSEFKLTTPAGATWFGHCSNITDANVGTSEPCQVDLSRPFPLVSLVFPTTPSGISLLVTQSTLSVSSATSTSGGSVATMTVGLAGNSSGNCSVDSTTSQLKYTLFSDASCNVTVDGKSISFSVPTTTASTFSAASSTLSLSSTSDTVSLGTSTSITVSATFKDSSGAAFSTGVSSNTVALVATQIKTSTGEKTASSLTVDCSKGSTCTANLPSVSTATTVIVSGKLNGSPFGDPQVITFK